MKSLEKAIHGQFDSKRQRRSVRKKKSLLLHALGPEAIDISETFLFTKDDGEKKDPTFDELVARFDAHYLPRVNVTFERHQFFTRNQEPGESVDCYITALRKLAQTCEFGEIRDSLVPDRFICGLSMVVVKEKLLAMPNITLETAIDKCKAAGLFKDQIRIIDAPADEEVADVKASGKTPVVHGSASAGAAAKANASRGRCTRCGYNHGSIRCPAMGKTCRICKGVGTLE